MPNTPRGREKNISGNQVNVSKKGEGLGTGPVGNAGGYAGRPGTGNGNGGGKRSTKSGSPLMIIIALIVAIGGGGTGLLSSVLGGSDDVVTTQATTAYVSTTAATQSTTASTGSSTGYYSGTSLNLASLLGGGTLSGSNVSTGWSSASNATSSQPDTTVAKGARSKYTNIKGNGKDTVTIMVYMCGADLESKSGMGTADLSEMIAAGASDKVNVIIYTGGASAWKNNAISSSTNQIYKVVYENGQGGLKRLESDMGKKNMTSPATLTEFIKYCAANYPADRNDLIFWDHGGGSLTGYGYDENYKNSGSMSLKGIQEALTNAGMKFDFIGFDACLMATVENGLMLDSFADYMIASEETEPGVGWYYTDWLKALYANTSMSTLEIGKNIADDFVRVCNQKCSGQKTTLSVVDLAELSATVPDKLNDFASSTLTMLQNDDYKKVADARSGAREFSQSSKIDQVDLVSMANKLGTDESKALAKALQSAVKYNKTSSNMTDAYGLSIYFPYQRAGKVNSAVSTYDAIGMDDAYSDCIKKFASLEVGGQTVSGGAANPLSALLSSGVSTGSSTQSMDMVSSLLSSLLSGSTGNVSGLTSDVASLLGRSLDDSDTAYLFENQFDANALVWSQTADGKNVMYLSDAQWELVTNLELNVFVNDGEGYIDLGLDNVYSFTDDGGLVGTYEGTWLAINDMAVAYYHMDTVDDGVNYTITGRVPAMVNGQRANLILVFDNDHPYGYVAGASYVYGEETETVAKALTEITEGDEIAFLCDYYSYDGSFLDSYYLSDPFTVSGDLVISDVYITNEVSAVYRFTDIYQQTYWTPEMN